MADKRDARVEGKIYNLREAEKAVRMQISPSWLQKDRLKVKPEVDFAKYGRAVRYSAD